MRSMLLPLIMLMSRLKYRQKFILVGLLFTLVMVAAVVFLFQRSEDSIRRLEQELDALELHRETMSLIESTNLYKNEFLVDALGYEPNRAFMEEQRREIESGLQALTEASEQAGMNEEWLHAVERVKSDWQAASAMQADAIGFEPAVVEHYRLVHSLLQLIQMVPLQTDLTGSADMRGGGLGLGSISRLPLLNYLLDQYLLTAITMQVSGGDASEEHVRLQVLSEAITASLQAFRETSGAGDSFIGLQSLIDAQLRLTGSLFAQTGKTLLSDAPGDGGPRATYELGMQAYENGYAIYNEMSLLLEQDLHQQIRTEASRQVVIVVAFTLFMLLMIGMFGAFAVSILESVGALERTSLQIAAGDYSVRLKVNTKDELKSVERAYNQMTSMFQRLLSEKERAEAQMRRLAYYDALTGLPNRFLFMDRLKQALSVAKRHSHKLGLLFIDLDNFKRINDTLGHQTGDAVLLEVGERLNRCLRETDTVARMGGDEFVVILPNLQEDQEAQLVAKKIMNLLAQPILSDHNEIIVSASIGVSMYPDNGEDIESLINRADSAMYAVKEHGKGNVQLFSQQSQEVKLDRIRLAGQLRRGIENEEFFVVYQPIADVETGLITGAEALLRWKHPEYGILEPDRFLPIAEETSLIVPLGDIAFRTACKQLQAWNRIGVGPLRLTCNVSFRQCQESGIIDRMRSTMAEFDVEPSRIALEFGHDGVFRNLHSSLRMIDELKALGVHIVIDNFGMGQVSMEQLKQVPFDMLKIDRTFIKDVPTGKKDSAFTASIISLTQHLNLRVTAVGVERREQADFLAGYRCDEMQGFYIGPPMEPERFASWIEEQRTG